MESQTKKDLILEEFLKALEHSRCNIFTLKAVAGKLEITEGELNLLFPEGLNEITKALLQKHKTELTEKIKTLEHSGVTEGIKRAVLLSFELLTPHKKALRNIVRHLLLPKNILFSPKFVYEISDTIWKGLGINDTNFAFYSKRLILSGIYSNCFFYFILSKQSEKLEEILSKQLSILGKLKRK